MHNRFTALVAAVIVVIGSSAYAGFKSSSQGTGTYTPPAGSTPNPLGDTDGDGISDGTDTDDDNDGVLDVADAFPLDATESLDTDSDGVGNNADSDDDGDTIADGDDAFPLDATQSIAALASSDVTTSCTENTCTVSGPFPAGATTITVTGTHASATDQTVTDTSGGTFSVTFNNLQSGAWTFTVEASNAGTTHLASASSSGSSAVVAELLDDPSHTFSSVAQLSSGGVSATITNALDTNSCGSAGNQSCLTAFNNQKASTICTLGGGASATAAQMDAYVSCIMIESYTADASSVSNSPASQSAASGCSTSVNIPKPGMCGYSAWTCPVTNLPSGWTNHATYIEVPSTASSTNVTLTVEMRLGSWTNHLIKTVSQPVDVVAAISGASNGYKLYNAANARDWNVWEAYDNCQNLGGALATLTEAADSGVLNGKTLYYGQKEGATTRPASVFWNASRYGTNYKGASENGNEKYIRSDGGGDYVCTAMDRYTCGSSYASTKYYVCKDLPACQ